MNHPPTESPDLLNRLMAEDRVHAHRSEDRRIFITTVDTVAATAILIALTLGPSRRLTLVLALWLTLIGLYGILACLKLAERNAFHTFRARSFRSRLIELSPGADAQRIVSTAEQAHSHVYPHLSRLRLNNLFLSLHLGMVAAGCISAVLVGTTGA